jgi:NAD(P)-dependent dehydrogenase (short-subunit alcohol dehydrogenase family)
LRRIEGKETIMRLSGKVAIVTGGGSGFGEGIVKKFIAEGARVVVVDRNGKAADAVAAAAGANAKALHADVTVKADVSAMLETAKSTSAASTSSSTTPVSATRHNRWTSWRRRPSTTSLPST